MNTAQINDRITSKTIKHFLAVGLKDITVGIDGFNVYHDGDVIAEFRTEIVGSRVDVKVKISDITIGQDVALTEDWHHSTPEGYVDQAASRLFDSCIGALLKGATYHSSGIICLRDGTLCDGFTSAAAAA